MQLSLEQMDLETVTQKFANTDRLWDISRTNPDGREQDGECLTVFALYIRRSRDLLFFLNTCVNRLVKTLGETIKYISSLYVCMVNTILVYLCGNST